MTIEIYSDGSATTSENCGGWAWVLIIDNKFHSEGSGYLKSATNNDAELVASIEGLEATLNFISSNPSSFPLEMEVTLISDSQICLNWANGKYRFKQLEKIDLYNRLRFLVKKMNVKTKWVKGHSGDIWNSRCDKLANNARKGIATKELDKPNTMRDTRIGIKKSGVVCLWYGDSLKVVDLENLVVEDYNREIHGKRGSMIQIREEKDR